MHLLKLYIIVIIPHGNAGQAAGVDVPVKKGQ
jgi:hypothetical protein